MYRYGRRFVVVPQGSLVTHPVHKIARMRPVEKRPAQLPGTGRSSTTAGYSPLRAALATRSTSRRPPPRPPRARRWYPYAKQNVRGRLASLRRASQERGEAIDLGEIIRHRDGRG